MTSRIGVLAMLVLLTSGAWTAPSQTALGDDQVRVRVERWFSDSRLPGITVTVHHGKVTLAGTVPNAWEKRRAYELVRSVEGVASVTSNLVIRPGAGDAAITTEVARRVQDYAFYTIFESVGVEVKDGLVTLTGEVMADSTVSAMANIAARVNGVVEVTNMIRTLAVAPMDDAIRFQIAERFYDDPMFSGDAHETRWPIRIIVEHGRVRLTGVVDSDAERRAAATIAREVGGVNGVDNRLLIRADCS